MQKQNRRADPFCEKGGDETLGLVHGPGVGLNLGARPWHQ